MKTEIQFNIERRESGDSDWHPFDIYFSDEADARQELVLRHTKYPRHHFRLVKETTTTEILEKVSAKLRATKQAK